VLPFARVASGTEGEAPRPTPELHAGRERGREEQQRQAVSIVGDFAVAARNGSAAPQAAIVLAGLRIGQPRQQQKLQQRQRARDNQRAELVVAATSGLGGGTSDTNGGCCGTSRRVPSSGGVMDPSSRFFCTGLSFMRRAVGAHALFAWAGEAVRASDRYAVSRGISLGGGLHACACGRHDKCCTAFSVLLFSLKLYFHGGRCPPSKYTRVPGHSAFVARTAAIQCVPVHEKAGLVSARLQRPENVFPFLRDLNRFIEHPPR